MWFCIPETKGLPLEEMAEIFGDKDEVIVYLRDIHVDQETHDIVADIHGEAQRMSISGKLETRNVEIVDPESK